jgi:hypothetical protein
MESRPRSLGYVLRLWERKQDGKSVWCASLQNPYTEERHAFADLAALVQFLQEKTEENQSQIIRRNGNEE